MNYGVLIDTNVLSEAHRPEPDYRVRSWFGGQHTASTYMSVITVGEIWNGIAKARDEVFKARLTHWIEVDLQLAFRGRILAVDEGVARIWGQMHAANRSQPVNVSDELIAATAVANGLTVATRNIRDFERCGVPTINPWEFE